MHWAATSVQLLLAFVVLRVLMLVLLNTSATAFYAQPPPSSPGQLELLKLSFFPAIFASAPSVGVLANADSDSLSGSCGSGWALEYAGAVRNMLYAPEIVPLPYECSTVYSPIGFTATARPKPC